MAFSMHSHSGQFCPGHAKDQLEDIIQTAIFQGMKTFALTEHMPRNSDEDLYPEEIAANLTISAHLPMHNAFLAAAQRLQLKYASQISILIGFEGEYIRRSYGPFMLELDSNPAVDFFIGSVHHVHGVPIDYDASMYAAAREKAGGTDERLFEDYFDAQYDMLNAVKPRVVGHFDLIKLLCDDRAAKKEFDWKAWKGVWERVVRNLKVVKEQGGLLEVNSAALRKGLDEPYPGEMISREWLAMGGRLTLSDDSHGIAQVGTNYGNMVKFLEGLGVEEVWTLEATGERGEGGKRVFIDKAVSMDSVKNSLGFE